MVEDPALDLLFDPQTSGGMLISIPSNKIEDLQIHLTKSGLLSSVIGEIRQGKPSVLLTNNLKLQEAFNFTLLAFKSDGSNLSNSILFMV